MKSNLAGLYIQIEAKKRRINIINLWKVPKWGGNMWRGRPRPRTLSRKSNEAPCNPFVKQGKAELAFCQRFHHELKSALAADVQIEAVHQEKCVSGGKSHTLVAVPEKRDY
jgi:hypothetical protein